MRILVLTRNAWDDTNSVGNTMSNFFKNNKEHEFANLYFRSSGPSNVICKRYYHVTEKDILKYFFFPSKCGKEFEYKPSELKTTEYSSEKKLISVVHKHKLGIAYTVSEMLWNSRKWLNGKLKRFVSDFNPDVVFAFAKSAPQYYWTIKYLHEKCNVKIRLWIADDEYSVLAENKSKKNNKALERLSYIINVADKVWGCSEEICELYNNIFNCNAEPMYKSCTFDTPVKTTVNKPLKFVYAGNLLFGRKEILSKIAEELCKINEKETVARLEIYSNTPVSEDDMKKLNIEGTSAFMGVRDYEEIRKIISQSDLVLHTESFDAKEIKKTRYSFSTKIIDCMQSGSVMLAIGPDVVSSVKYIKKIPGAFVVDTEEKIGDSIRKIIEQKDSLPERAKKIRKFAENKHSAYNIITVGINE